MRLIDTHAHLDFPDLSAHITQVLDDASAAGVERIVTIGASRGLESNQRALDLARAYPSRLRCTAGIHPHDADMASPEVIETIARDFSTQPEVVAIGETGLDYHYNKSSPENQRRVFRAFLRMSKKVGKPVTIHSRDAEEDTLKLLRDEGVTGGILHCFTGSRAFAQALVELDFYFSFSGIITFNSAQDILKTAVEVVPIDRLLVETDSPYLAPVPKRGKPNQPAFVAHTAAHLAKARGISPEELAQHTWRNAHAVMPWGDEA